MKPLQPVTPPQASPVPSPVTAETKTPGLAYVPVTLPSKRRLYGPDAVIPTPAIEGGVVEIRKMLIAEDEILASSGGTVLTRLGKVMSQCSRLPQGFDPNKLLLLDRLYLLLAIRSHTFGSHYQVAFKCPECGHQNKTDIDVVTDLDETPLDDDFVEPFDVILPDLNVIVGLRLLRGIDESDALRQVKAAKARGMEPTPVQDQLRQIIVTIDGEKVENPMTRIDLIRRMSAVDVRAVREAMVNADFGVDLSTSLECSKCSTVTAMGVPFGPDFFRPTGD